MTSCDDGMEAGGGEDTTVETRTHVYPNYPPTEHGDQNEVSFPRESTPEQGRYHDECGLPTRPISPVRKIYQPRVNFERPTTCPDGSQRHSTVKTDDEVNRLAEAIAQALRMTPVQAPLPDFPTLRHFLEIKKMPI